MSMNRERQTSTDQADSLRKIVAQQQGAQLEKVPTGTLPPRSTIHKKPPLNLTPYYIGGTVLLLLVAVLCFWWYATRSVPSVAQPRPEVGSQTPAKKELTSVSGTAVSGTAVSKLEPSQQASQFSEKLSGMQSSKPLPAAPPNANQAPKSPSSAKATPVNPSQTPPKAKPVQAKAKVETVHASKSAPPYKKRRLLRHRVQPGDTLYKISVMYYGTGKYQFYLARYNGIRNTNNVYAGSVIKVPLPPR
ncbi:LysM peptidoglycan-binding domain-containing protein [Aneurinibacillus thermoaerophilus]|uniref:LysM peptidoglycan-binding domain-containing protein n=2 Tax=Aneurinibacillus thermoaerophilus TaxID=143495 RepID=UPI002E1C1F7F|nr:LysM peptidoglycan-binding domain-containing protein [Aneurinibacillus thermoaerophilus]